MDEMNQEQMEEFFAKFEDYVVRAKFYECDEAFTLEQLYQAFKKRALTELAGPEL